MSSSPAQSPTKELVRPFVYSEVAVATNPELASFIHSGDRARDPSESDAGLHRQIAAARREGRDQAVAETRIEFENALNSARANVAAALRDFAHERAKYYQNVEGEVVRLALNIARHILHREAQIDEFLLAGLVRVALEKIESRTGVVLRTNPAHVGKWRAYFAQHLEPAFLPEIKEDASIDVEHCVIETSLGSAQVGMELQLQEIERGFMDLLAQRPGEKP